MEGAGMPSHVVLAHTGKRLQVEPASFTSLEAFRTWVAKNSSISVQNHVALTAQGKPVKLQMLSTEEIFIFDRQIGQPSSFTPIGYADVEIPLPSPYAPSKAPDTIADQKDLEAWKGLFNARRTWTLKIVDDCTSMSNEVQDRYAETHFMAIGVDAAIYNLEKHVKAVDQKNADIQIWSRDIQREQEAAGKDWDTTISRLRSLPATTDMIEFITGRTPRKNRQNPTLEDFVDAKDIKRAEKLVKTITTNLNRDSAALGTKVDYVLKEMDGLFDKVESDPSRSILNRTSEPIRLIEDIEAIAKKVSNDYESVLGYSNNPKGVSQASKSALLHTKNLLPSLLKRASEMDGILQSATEARNGMASRSLDIMRTISSLTALVTEANSQFAVLKLDGEGFDAIHLLGMLNTLPTTYASFIAEAIRRREWNDKIRSDSITLTNEMATFQEEEARRRRKWQKATGSMLWGDRPEQKVMGLEVNLHDDEEEWPQAARQDLEEMVEVLKAQDPKSQIAVSVSKIFTDLNNPTRQQSRRAKAFKAGSIHEAALGRSALLVRGDNESLRSMLEDKQKLESRVKTAESRVRRLEDLLHRGSQTNRNSTGTAFQIPSQPSPDAHIMANPLASPRPHDDQSRRSSVSSRRLSAIQGADEKAIQQKLLSAEAETIAEREKVAGLEKEISARKTKAEILKSQVDEVNSTKQDLLHNFNAQQTEFAAERKSLEGEIRNLKSRLEEVEDEMERQLGSRTDVDDRVNKLHNELEKARKDHSSEIQKAQGQVDFLRNDSKLQRQTNEILERQLQRAKEEKRELLSRVEKAESTAQEQHQILHDVHAQLSPKSPSPIELPALAEVVVGLLGDLVSELESAKSEATIARSDRDTTQKELAAVKSEREDLKVSLEKEQTNGAHLREMVDSERAKFKALEDELVDERGQLSSLRTKISDGETGSEALRNRLEEEERKVTRMSEDLATRQSRIGSLEEELRSFQDKYEFSQKKHETLTLRFESRSDRAKDLSRRVYEQNDRLCKLLGKLSYSVTRDGSTMSIQRLPKTDKSNPNDSSDPGSSLKKSIPDAVTSKAMVDSTDMDLLYWMHNDDANDESKRYEAFINAIGFFDLHAFCDVITKRIKDIEYTAKKYSRDARAYREKSHMAQKEAHEKIAYKHFKEGDLALFLPTRNQTTGAWAAFNVGAPHYFLREQDSHKLSSRDWLLARIHKIQDRVVDLSKPISSSHANAGDSTSLGGDSFEDDNPFELSDGLRWYLIDATEEKPGAPSTPGLGKSTVASAHEIAPGQMIRRSKKSSSSGIDGINKTLSKSLDSRRSSSNSKKAIPIAASSLIKTGSIATDTASLKAASTTGIQSPGEPSDAQLIRPGSRHEQIASSSNAPGTEVRNPAIDDLMGP